MITDVLLSLLGMPASETKKVELLHSLQGKVQKALNAKFSNCISTSLHLLSSHLYTYYYFVVLFSL